MARVESPEPLKLGVADGLPDGILPSCVNPRCPLTSTGSSIKIKGAKTMLSKKYWTTTLADSIRTNK